MSLDSVKEPGGNPPISPVQIGIAAALLVIGLIVGWFLHKAVDSPADLAAATQYDDWRLTCPKLSDKDTSCEMQLDIPDAKGQTELARLQIFHGKEAGKDTNVMIVTVPFNVLLDPGTGLQFDKDKPRVYAFEVCNQMGCVARVPFDDAVAKAMQNAKTARILVAGLDGKAAALPFSLKGFASAHSAFESDLAKRHSWWRRLWS